MSSVTTQSIPVALALTLTPPVLAASGDAGAPAQPAVATAVPTLMLFAHRLDLPLAVPAAKARP